MKWPALGKEIACGDSNSISAAIMQGPSPGRTTGVWGGAWWAWQGGHLSDGVCQPTELHWRALMPLLCCGMQVVAIRYPAIAPNRISRKFTINHRGGKTVFKSICVWKKKYKHHTTAIPKRRPATEWEKNKKSIKIKTKYLILPAKRRIYMLGALFRITSS